MTSNTIPLTRQTFETVLQAFNIPKIFLKTFSRRTAAFHSNIAALKGDNSAAAVKSSWSNLSQCVGFVHQTDSNTKAFFSIGGSYCPNTGMTSILLCGLHNNDSEIGELKRRLQYLIRRVPSPFLVSSTLLEMRFESLESRIDEVHKGLHLTKHALGLASTMLLPMHSAPDPRPMKSAMDIAEISKDVTRAISTSASKIYGCEAYMKIGPNILEAAEICLRLVPDSRRPYCHDAMTEVSSGLKHHAVWLCTVHTRAQYLMHRAQGYASTVRIRISTYSATNVSDGR